MIQESILEDSDKIILKKTLRKNLSLKGLTKFIFSTFLSPSNINLKDLVILMRFSYNSN